MAYDVRVFIEAGAPFLLVDDMTRNTNPLIINNTEKNKCIICAEAQML